MQAPTPLEIHEEVYKFANSISDASDKYKEETEGFMMCTQLLLTLMNDALPHEKNAISATMVVLERWFYYQVVMNSKMKA